MANSYVTLDLMRPNSTLIDITDSFNGRVGDSESYVKLWFKSNGLPYDLTGKEVGFWGNDPNGTKFQIIGTAKTDQAGDSENSGRVSFYFPANVFQTSGNWDDDSTFFSINDKDGNRLSTVNVHLNVLSDNVMMGIEEKPYISDLDKIKDDMNTYCEATKVTVNKALSEVTDENSNLNKTLSAVKTQVTAYQDAINTGAVPSKSDFEAFKTTVNNTITKLSKDLVIENRGAVSDIRKPSFFISNYSQKMHTEYVNGTQLGLSSGFYILETFTPYTDVVNGAPMQRATLCTTKAAPVMYTRNGATADTWTAWAQITTW